MLICFRITSESIEYLKKTTFNKALRSNNVSQVWKFSFLLKIDSIHKISVLK